MSEAKLGFTPKDNQRDAVHVCIVPIVVGEDMNPGDKVRMGTDRRAYHAQGAEPVGVIDPFIKLRIAAGQLAYLILTPGTQRTLTHQWTHPAFDGGTREDSILWVRCFAEQVGLGFAAVMGGADTWLRTWQRYKDSQYGGGHYIAAHHLKGQSVPDEFWDHYEAITGDAVPAHKKGSFFSCNGCS